MGRSFEDIFTAGTISIITMFANELVFDAFKGMGISDEAAGVANHFMSSKLSEYAGGLLSFLNEPKEGIDTQAKAFEKFDSLSEISDFASNISFDGALDVLTENLITPTAIVSFVTSMVLKSVDFNNEQIQMATQVANSIATSFITSSATGAEATAGVDIALTAAEIGYAVAVVTISIITIALIIDFAFFDKDPEASIEVIFDSVLNSFELGEQSVDDGGRIDVVKNADEFYKTILNNWIDNSMIAVDPTTASDRVFKYEETTAYVGVDLPKVTIDYEDNENIIHPMDINARFNALNVDEITKGAMYAILMEMQNIRDSAVGGIHDRALAVAFNGIETLGLNIDSKEGDKYHNFAGISTELSTSHTMRS
ncbi:MAG: hypothetical protein MRY63_07090 [Neomegalonema sp.]|nr:hypothetical protein [Neomegalonema sp.]